MPTATNSGRVLGRIALLLALASGVVRAQPVDGPAPTPAAPPSEAPPSTPSETAPSTLSPPRLSYAEDPVYPEARLAEGEHPSVVFQVVIARDGTVRDAVVEHSAGADFDEAARAALVHWRFEPARRNGEPVASRVRVAVHFELPSFDLPTTEAHAHDVVAVDDAPLDADRHDLHLHEPPASDAPSAEPEPAPDADVGASAEASLIALRNQQRAASDFRLDRAVLDLAPHRDAGELLTRAPGLVVTRPEGDAVAHRILLRGFDAEHGQDVELTVDGLPINQASHLHGQGYADLGFVIPEVVRGIRVTEGVYDPNQGDFAVAGTAAFELGVERRGITAISQMGSFRTFREALIIAPEGRDPGTFVAFQARRTDGFGARRAGMSASTMARLVFGDGPWRLHLLAAASGARSDTAGVVRRDDLAQVGFYGVYDDPSARSQNAFSARALLALGGEHRGRDGSNDDFIVSLGFTDFRSQMNFTGYTETSRVEPTWRGRGDLVEQTNRATSLYGRFRHRSARFAPTRWLAGTIEAASSLRFDLIDQSQSLLAAPRNETWDRRIDASIVGSDLGMWVDADLDLGERVSVRGGVRADALLYDVNDRLGNFVPAYRHDDYILGYRRTAFGIAAGPRVSIDVHPARGPRYLLAYGEGYRSPQAITLEDGERAPFTKVRSLDAGLRHEARIGRATLELSATGFFTQLSDDLVFEPSENRYERIGATRRLGAVVAARARYRDLLDGQISFTGVHATMLDPPPATAEDPSPPFAPGQLLPYVPPVVVRADVGAHHALFALRGRDVVGSIGAGFSYVGKRPLPYAQRAQDFALLDAQASLAWRGISLGISGQNLLGTQYPASEYLYVSNWDPSAVPSRIPARHIAAGAPRTLMFTVGITP